MSTLKKYLSSFLNDDTKSISSNLQTIELNLVPDSHSIHCSHSYISKANNACSEIFNDFFKADDDIIFGSNFFVFKGYENEKRNIRIHQYVKSSAPLKSLNCTSSTQDDEDISEIKHYYLNAKVKDLKHSLLIKDIVNKDFGKEKKGLEDYFIVNLSKDIILYLYDDRCVHIAAKNAKDREYIKETYKGLL